MSIETEKENDRIIDLSSKLDRIKVKGVGNMAENYLNSEEESPTIFSRNITRSKPKEVKDTGFNMDDILAPKEDLDEIMKAFDFFMETHPDEE